MTEHQCPCGQPAPDATICRSCTDRLAADLGDIPSYTRELEITLARLTRYGDRGDGSPSTTALLPFDLRASEASRVLRNTLVGWIRVLDEDSGDWPADDLTAMSRWLLTRVDQLARHEAGDQAANEIGAAVAEVRRVVDRPPDQIYAGICGAPLDGADVATSATMCDADLYALPGRGYVTCRACGASYGVEDRRQYLLDELEGTLATATEIARGISRLGQPVTAERIRQWKARERLEACGVNLRGDPLYRVGDVLDLLALHERRVAS